MSQLRSGLQITRLDQQGLIFYRIEDPITERVFELFELEYEIVMQLDYEVSLFTLLGQLHDEKGLVVEPAAVRKLLSTLQHLGIIKTPPPGSLAAQEANAGFAYHDLEMVPTLSVTYLTAEQLSTTQGAVTAVTNPDVLPLSMPSPKRWWQSPLASRIWLAGMLTMVLGVAGLKIWTNLPPARLRVSVLKPQWVVQRGLVVAHTDRITPARRFDIKAPAAGTLGRWQVAVGNLVTAKQPLVELLSTNLDPKQLWRALRLDGQIEVLYSKLQRLKKRNNPIGRRLRRKLQIQYNRLVALAATTAGDTHQSILADHNALLANIWVSSGQKVDAGQVLFSLVEPHGVSLVFTVDTNRWGAGRPGQTVWVETNAHERLLPAQLRNVAAAGNVWQVELSDANLAMLPTPMTAGNLLLQPNQTLWQLPKEAVVLTSPPYVWQIVAEKLVVLPLQLMGEQGNHWLALPHDAATTGNQPLPWLVGKSVKPLSQLKAGTKVAVMPSHQAASKAKPASGSTNP